MAGWSAVADENTVDRCKIPKKLDAKKLSDCLEPLSKGLDLEGETELLVRMFQRLLEVFFKHFCSAGSFRPLPPMTGNGTSVDLLKLFLDVLDKGGFETVTKNGLWKKVAEESGLKPNFAASIKLIYVKYLDAFGRWLIRVVEKENDSRLELSGISTELEAELKGFLSEIKKRYNLGPGGNLMESREELERVLSELKKRYDEYHRDKESLFADMEKDVENLGIARKNLAECLVDEDAKVLDSGFKEMPSPRKRKRESTWEILNWVIKVAKNPCDPEIGSLPERSKWVSYGSNEIWKQVLLFRIAMSQRKSTDSPSEKFSQKYQKMHPSMYSDNIESCYNLRERLSFTDSPLSESKAVKSEVPSGKGLSAKDSDERSEIPIGSEFQVEVPEWTGITSESDSKWLGTRVWPLDGRQSNRFLIERDPIGKGRQESCGCQVPGSTECVKFHVTEKRAKLKLELGSAFHNWEITKMGEEVALSWSNLEQKNLNALIKTPPLLHNSFLQQMGKVLPTKSRADVVNYYYNVILLQHRAKQNRSSPCIIDSDEEEPDSELATDDHTPQASKSTKPILLTPQKPNRRVR